LTPSSSTRRAGCAQRDGSPRSQAGRQLVASLRPAAVSERMRESRRHTATRRTGRRGVVWRFVECINRGDVDKLGELMSPRHLLVDSLGARVRGRRVVQRAWVGYFRMVPGYRIQIEEELAQRTATVLVGRASGGYRPLGRSASVGRWSIPAAWRVVVRRGLVAEWQVYADNEPLRQLARKRSPGRRRAGR
jgi:ketosteroid isomerase-like protein